MNMNKPVLTTLALTVVLLSGCGLGSNDGQRAAAKPDAVNAEDAPPVTDNPYKIDVQPGPRKDAKNNSGPRQTPQTTPHSWFKTQIHGLHQFLAAEAGQAQARAAALRKQIQGWASQSKQTQAHLAQSLSGLTTRVQKLEKQRAARTHKHAPARTAKNASKPSHTRRSCRAGGAAQYDVTYTGDSRAAAQAAIAKIKHAGLTDFFVGHGGHRVYLGRYGTCGLAKRRRAAVHHATGLSLAIANIKHAAHTTHTARRRPSRFALIGVELHGGHAYLGVAPPHAAHMADVYWLSPGDSYRHWRLETIDAKAKVATFAVRGHTVAVKLPSQG